MTSHDTHARQARIRGRLELHELRENMSLVREACRELFRLRQSYQILREAVFQTEREAQQLHNEIDIFIASYSVKPL